MRLIEKKPPTDEKLLFAKMGAKTASKVATIKKVVKAKKSAKKAKAKGKASNFYAAKAAVALAGK